MVGSIVHVDKKCSNPSSHRVWVDKEIPAFETVSWLGALSKALLILSLLLRAKSTVR